MGKRIRITAGKVVAAAELNESPTARAIWDALPITGQANLWGLEIYFRIPVSAEEEDDARAEVDLGALAYWPPGSAFCIFFGPTPASSGTVPTAASPVNVFGKVEGSPDAFRKVRNGEAVRIEAAE